MNDSCVIWLHGLGDSSDSWSELKETIGVKLPHIQWEFPKAPCSPVDANGGILMASWFNIQGIPFDKDRKEDQKGILHSVELVHQLIHEKVKQGIPLKNIILGGYSQGASIAILAGLLYEKPLGGIVSLSGWLPLRDVITKYLQQQQHQQQEPSLKHQKQHHHPSQKSHQLMSLNVQLEKQVWEQLDFQQKNIQQQKEKSSSIMMCHGTADEIVEFDQGKQSKIVLEKLGYHVDWKEYEKMAHSSSNREIQDLYQWLAKHLPTPKKP